MHWPGCLAVYASDCWQGTPVGTAPLHACVHRLAFSIGDTPTLLPLSVQALAKCAVQHPTPEHLRQAVMRALLALPEKAFVPPPRPPLPSPPPTPPPPPLATSQFAWDALDRPCVTDGAVVISTNA